MEGTLTQVTIIMEHSLYSCHQIKLNVKVRALQKTQYHVQAVIPGRCTKVKKCGLKMYDWQPPVVYEDN